MSLRLPLFAAALALAGVACGEPEVEPRHAVSDLTAASDSTNATQVPAAEEHNDVTRGSGMDSNRPGDRGGQAAGGGATVDLTTGNGGGQAGEPGTNGAGVTTDPSQASGPATPADQGSQSRGGAGPTDLP